MGAPPVVLDQLDRRIAAALQVDGRTSWRRIAAALGEPERTVARRGTQLVKSGLVVVSGFSPGGAPALIRARCTPGMARPAAAWLATRADCTFAYLLTGRVDCVAELFSPPQRLATFALDELAGTPGLVGIETDPVTTYFRAVHEWQPGVLTANEAAALIDFTPVTPEPGEMNHRDLDRDEQAIVRALADDGRLTNEELARIAGVSEPTARRRVDSLRSNGILFVRAVMEPAILGLPTEAMLWIRTEPRRVNEVGDALIKSRFVRYAASTMGEHQIVANVATPNMLALHEFITGSAWSAHATSVETSLIIAAPKRTGVLATSLRS